MDTLAALGWSSCATGAGAALYTLRRRHGRHVGRGSSEYQNLAMRRTVLELKRIRVTAFRDPQMRSHGLPRSSGRHAQIRVSGLFPLAVKVLFSFVLRSNRQKPITSGLDPQYPNILRYARPLLPLLAPCVSGGLASPMWRPGRGGGADAARGRQSRQQDAGYYGAACTSPNPAIPIPIRRR